jgi:protein involved in polysaccharide export with SLBB domain
MKDAILINTAGLAAKVAIRIFALVILFLCSAPWCGCASNGHDRASEGPVLQNGDHLVFGDKRACSLGDIALSIDENGMVSLPLAQKMQLGGLTLKEAESQINEMYKPFLRNPDFFLRLGAQNAEMKQYITLRGEFQQPGIYAWTDRLTAGAAIELAGGLNPSARIRQVYLIPSRGRPPETIQLTQDFRVKKDIALHTGDLIYAPAE